MRHVDSLTLILAFFAVEVSAWTEMGSCAEVVFE